MHAWKAIITIHHFWCIYSYSLCSDSCAAQHSTVAFVVLHHNETKYLPLYPLYPPRQYPPCPYPTLAYPLHDGHPPYPYPMLFLQTIITTRLIHPLQSCSMISQFLFAQCQDCPVLNDFLIILYKSYSIFLSLLFRHWWFKKQLLFFSNFFPDMEWKKTPLWDDLSAELSLWCACI